jgi:galactokinase
MTTKMDRQAVEQIVSLARKSGLDISGGRIRRTSSRFCLGVEHGDYNGTELFGVGTDRFIWLAYKPNGTGRIKLISGNFPENGLINFRPGEIPPPSSPETAGTWARFPFGVDYILRSQGFPISAGMDGVIWGNIPGGGMSRSASLSLNLILSLLEINGLEVSDPFQVVDLAQAVENDYIGSPCGQLDQIMILFAREGLGTHYNPKNRTVRHIPLGGDTDFRLVSLDTGTDRPGLEKSTYRIRRFECEQLAGLLKDKYRIEHLADIKDRSQYEEIMTAHRDRHPDLCDRLDYIFHAQRRFTTMLDAWKKGDVRTLGHIFREDGIGLRDVYKISGPELETMCDIARTVGGVYGERMLGGGDKGASGALIAPEGVEALKNAVETAYPRSRPEYARKYALHVLRMVEGVRLLENML